MKRRCGVGGKVSDGVVALGVVLAAGGVEWAVLSVMRSWERVRVRGTGIGQCGERSEVVM
jgi:hypothetical protein